MPIVTRLAVAALAPFALTTVAHAATSISYAPVDVSQLDAWLVTWQAGHRAHLVTSTGMSDGSWTQAADGTRTLVLDTPIVTQQQANDYCDPSGVKNQEVDLQQVTFHLTSGTMRKGNADVVGSGRTIDEDGCTPGAINPYTNPTMPTRQLDMTARPSVADLVPGTTFAGFSETPFGDGTLPILAQDVVKIGSGDVTFAATGHLDAMSMSDSWFVVDIGGGETRAFTRLTAMSNGQEEWLVATWEAGAPTHVWQWMMTKPLSGAGFGGRAKAAHQWDSGLFMGSATTTTWFDLYTDFTGTRTLHDVPSNTDFVQAVTWNFSGLNLVTHRVSGGFSRDRTWVPLANHGKLHFVMETETYTSAGGPGTTIYPRVNYYLDEGVATPPASATRASETRQPKGAVQR